MTPAEVVEKLQKLNPDAYLLLPREIFDRALIGYTDDPRDHWPREEKQTVAVYDRDKCLAALMEEGPLDWPEAVDWFEYNTRGSWMGEGTPTFYDATEHLAVTMFGCPEE